MAMVHDVHESKCTWALKSLQPSSSFPERLLSEIIASFLVFLAAVVRKLRSVKLRSSGPNASLLDDVSGCGDGEGLTFPTAWMSRSF